MRRLSACRERVLVGELGGAAGTLASLGATDRGSAALCRRLGLGVPTTPWHAARDGFGELISTLGRPRRDDREDRAAVIRLQSTEVAEAG